MTGIASCACVAGIPMIMSEVQVREILRAFGTLKAFLPIPLQVSRHSQKLGLSAAAGALACWKAPGDGQCELGLFASFTDLPCPSNLCCSFHSAAMLSLPIWTKRTPSCLSSSTQNAAVCQFEDQTATEAAVAGITTMAVAGSTLRVRRPSEDVTAAAACAAVGLPSANPATGKPPAPAAAPAPKPAEQQQAQQQQAAPAAATPTATAQQPSQPQPAAAPAAAPTAAPAAAPPLPAAAAPAAPTRVVRLSNMLTREELADPEEYDDIVDDILQEIQM
jgi:hypothetical protein